MVRTAIKGDDGASARGEHAWREQTIPFADGIYSEGSMEGDGSPGSAKPNFSIR